MAFTKCTKRVGTVGIGSGILNKQSSIFLLFFILRRIKTYCFTGLAYFMLNFFVKSLEENTDFEQT